MNRPISPSRVGVRRPSSAPRRGNDLQEDALRAILGDDPNDRRAFEALAAIVRRQAESSDDDGDPLTAEHDAEPTRRADLAVWALGEELAGNPRAWLPLLELARLSIVDDHESALRRLATAAERDHSGQALAEALGILREVGLHAEALGLGTGHWRPAEHTPDIARHLVLAALDAERPAEAQRHLDALDSHPDAASVAALRAELGAHVARATQHTVDT